MTDTKKRVVLVLPTYNERENVKILVPFLADVTRKEKNYKFTYLFVDDTSPDGTADELRILSKTYSEIQIIIGKKEGLGKAYMRGMHFADSSLHADILFEMDCDLSHDPKVIHKFLRELEKGVDYVVGSRYIKGGSIPKDWPLSRKFFSVIGNITARYGLMIPKIKEWSSGYRAMRKEVFLSICDGLENYAGYTFQIASLHRVTQTKYTISEIPIQFIDRKFGESKFQVLNYAPNVIKYVLFNSSFIRFVITGFIGFGVDFGIAYLLISFLGVYEPLANMISASIAVTTNFFINNFWSFSYKKITGGTVVMVKQYAKFIAIGIGSIIIQGAGMYLAITLFGNGTITVAGVSIPLWVLYKVLIIAFVIIPYSYIMYNKFVWKKE